jgi:hypothetical protein
MKKAPINPLADQISEMIARLCKESDAARLILCPAICTTCGKAWLLRKSSDSQYSHHHGCRRGQHYNLRIQLERIGDTKAERAKLSDAYRAAVK